MSQNERAERLARPLNALPEINEKQNNAMPKEATWITAESKK